MGIMHSKGPPLRIPNTLVCTRSYCHHHMPCLTHKLQGSALMPPWDLATSTLDNTSDLTALDNLISNLHRCRGKTDRVYAKLLHTHICSYGLEALSAVGNHMVPMFVACENVADAQHVFNKLDHRSPHSWSSLISGYIQCGQLQDAISLYQKVEEDGSYLPLALLKACTKLKDVERGRRMHIDIIQKGFEQDLYIGSTLIDMYVKCGLVLEAHSVLDKMRDRNVVSWNALIAGYADYEPGEKALHCFHQMQTEGVAADAVTFMCMLKVCHCVGAMDMGREIHRNIVSNGLEQHLFVGSSLVSMYANCGFLVEAWEIFNNLHFRDAVSWTTLLAGCAEHGAGQETLKHIEQMRQEGISPTAYLYACSFKACGGIAMAEKGREMHIEVVKKGFEEDVYVGSSLIDMYAKCCLLLEAWEVFDKMPARNVVSWNALIAGYADHGPGQNALKCHEQMQLEHVSPDAVTLACILKSCANMGAVGKGQEVHMEVMQKGLEKDLLVGTSLVDMYANFGSVLDAQEVFGKMAVRNVVSWNVLIAGYAEHGPNQQALTCFEELKLQGVSPSAITYTCVLEACSKIRAFEKGQEMHSEIITKGFERDYFVGNVLVDLYVKRGSLAEAQEIFDKLPARSFESWTSLITGYAEHEWSSEALRCFEQMKSEGVFLDVIVFVCVLKACGCIGAIEKGQEVHQEILKKGFEGDPFVGITLVDVYSKCNSLSEAHDVFHMLPDRNVVAWNALIGGYAEHGPTQVALKCYDEMQLQGVCPSIVTYVSVLKACGNMGAIEKGREIHKELRQKGFEADPFVASTLIDMYGECGSLSEAWEAFNKLPGRNVVSWNAMLKGFSINHEGNMAVHLFKEMQQQGVKPDAITFTCLFTACSRASLVLKGLEYFQAMMEDYGIVPTLEHLACMVDVLARSGHLHQAEKLFESLPHLPSKEMWTVLLSACKTFAEVELGQRCFEQLVWLDQESAVPYTLMASIYATSGRWDDVKRVEELRKLAGAAKKPAGCLIQANKVHEVLAGLSNSIGIALPLSSFLGNMKQA